MQRNINRRGRNACLPSIQWYAETDPGKTSRGGKLGDYFVYYNFYFDKQVLRIYYQDNIIPDGFSAGLRHEYQKKGTAGLVQFQSLMGFLPF